MFVAEQKIVIAFLDWGLGHATRCMPLIDILLEQKKEIVLAGNGKSLLAMQQQYPQLKSYELPDYNIQYHSKKNAAWQILFQAPKIYKAIRKEHLFLQKIVAQEKIEVIISDNRYGVYHKNCKNIFLSHQIAIQAPKPFKFTEPFLLKQVLKLISKFNELWIPDFEDEKRSLSGKMAHGIPFPIPVKYIGLLSRFQKTEKTTDTNNPSYEIVALLSGVEPSRSEFEHLLKVELGKLEKNCLIICGQVEKEKKITRDKNITIVNFSQGDELLHFLQNATFIICRSGYSTLMDLAVLNKKAILIPTPGQTEQEYLAQNLASQNLAVYQKQAKLDLVSALATLSSLGTTKNDLD